MFITVSCHNPVYSILDIALFQKAILDKIGNECITGQDEECMARRE